MSPSNKVIVEKAQNILEEYGYKVKTGHLYELFSKLSNEKSYNVAKAKNVSFADQLNLSSTENSSEALDSKDSSRNLAEELRLKIPLQFKNGKNEYVITPEMFAEFRANDQMNQLKSVLAELEILGFILEPNPQANILSIKLRSAPTNSVLNLVKSLVKESKKKESGHRAFFNDYVKELTKGTYKNKMLYGLKEDGSGYLVVDPVGEPGSYFCGGMGSGKSVAMRFSAATHMLSNNDKTFYFFVDPHKGMSDCRVLFLDENNHMRSNTVFLEEKAQIDKMIDFLYNELSERKNFFNRVSAYNIYEFHKKSQMNLSFIQVFFEDFHAIPSLINFENEHSLEGTTAYKFATLTRLGRSFGIFFNAASQLATSKEFPKFLSAGFSHKFSFHHYNPQDHEALNLPLGNEIKAAERGRCAYEKGFLQFPYLSDEDIKSLLKTHLKEFHSNFLFKTVEEVKSSLG